ncbi:hypothetical protein [Conexibacter sp. CPCC 206217]|uniref:hypothetical protein n=1 Tax=Conexibacter sp. CPCC 206217 TaxID=3064574 RepID=UPI0027273436|nr:hypothetical protein [Conexibacter sp. CPCC 206217]MDO8208972.1 hypothetical protein [Conexibacter sp. CPCC 206217]
MRGWSIHGLDDGMQVCPHCNGYGSSLKEGGDRCSQCGGSGVVPIPSTPAERLVERPR